jgi:hypothetical protein
MDVLLSIGERYKLENTHIFLLQLLFSKFDHINVKDNKKKFPKFVQDLI